MSIAEFYIENGIDPSESDHMDRFLKDHSPYSSSARRNLKSNKSEQKKGPPQNIVDICVPIDSLSPSQKESLQIHLGELVTSLLGEANEVLVEYVMVMIENGKNMEVVNGDLVELIGEEEAKQLAHSLGEYIAQHISKPQPAAATSPHKGVAKAEEEGQEDSSDKASSATSRRKRQGGLLMSALADAEKSHAQSKTKGLRGRMLAKDKKNERYHQQPYQHEETTQPAQVREMAEPVRANKRPQSGSVNIDEVVFAVKKRVKPDTTVGSPLVSSTSVGGGDAWHGDYSSGWSWNSVSSWTGKGKGKGMRICL